MRTVGGRAESIAIAYLAISNSQILRFSENMRFWILKSGFWNLDSEIWNLNFEKKKKISDFEISEKVIFLWKSVSDFRHGLWPQKFRNPNLLCRNHEKTSEKPNIPTKFYKKTEKFRLRRNFSVFLWEQVCKVLFSICEWLMHISFAVPVDSVSDSSLLRIWMILPRRTKVIVSTRWVFEIDEKRENISLFSCFCTFL